MDVTAVELPYAGKEFSLILMLPGKQTEFVARKTFSAMIYSSSLVFSPSSYCYSFFTFTRRFGGRGREAEPGELGLADEELPAAGSGFPDAAVHAPLPGRPEHHLDPDGRGGRL